MAAIPGVRFDITGASGSQGFLSPKSSWRAYVFPRGGYAAQDSAGTLITFDSAAIAGRFAANNWIQVGLATANIRQVAAVGGNSISVSGAALTVTENDRVFLIGQTQPTVTGGSATYTIPATTIRQRDDDGSDLYTNSMVTTNSDGLVQFFSDPAVYDMLIQDGNQSNQGSIVDLPVGVAEGISTSYASVFGATVTINAAFGITGVATFGQTVTMNAALGVTGWATFGASVTMNAALGVTGTATFGATLTAQGNVGFTGSLTLGVSGVIDGLSVTTGIFGCTNQPRVILANSADQVTASGGSLALTWNTEHADVGGFHAAGSSQITIPAGHGGLYYIYGQITWASGHSGNRYLSLSRSGGNVLTSTVSAITGQTGMIRAHVSGFDVVAPGEVLTLNVLQESGASQTITMTTNTATSQFKAIKLF